MMRLCYCLMYVRTYLVLYVCLYTRQGESKECIITQEYMHMCICAVLSPVCNNCRV